MPTEAEKFKQRGRHFLALLNQGKTWIPKGAAPVRVADMEPRWRFNAARFLLRHAGSIAMHYNFGEVEWLTAKDVIEVHVGEVLESAQEERAGHPVEWMRSTPLYKALVQGLESEPDPDSEPLISPALRDDALAFAHGDPIADADVWGTPERTL